MGFLHGRTIAEGSSENMPLTGHQQGYLGVSPPNPNIPLRDDPAGSVAGQSMHDQLSKKGGRRGSAGSSSSTGESASSVAKAARALTVKGKVASTFGTLIGSASLKQKSKEHLAQAEIKRGQASELSQAEKEEHEAAVRRQHAMGLGGGLNRHSAPGNYYTMYQTSHAA
ncbi:hypothetical protein IAU60_004418 [Kwoniella sp. DSM 27419]